MLLHALRLAWNRKRRNALVLLELVGSFLVLFAVVLAALAAWRSFVTPLGFDWQNVWIVHAQVDRNLLGLSEENAAKVPDLFLAELESLDAVESAAIGLFPVFDPSGMRTTWEDDGERVAVELFPASPGMERTLGLELASGRFLGEEDRGDPLSTVVINRKLASEVWGADVDPVGRVLVPPGAEDSEGYRVVGMVEHFRKAGDLRAEGNMAFQPLWTDQPLGHGLVTFFLRVRPGTTAATEKEILDRFHAIAPTWRFDVDWLEENRQRHLRLHLAPIAIGGLVAGFLLLMVGLGLTGVLWQNVTLRTREIGLRRAVGATGPAVRWQVLLELQLLSLLGIALGTLVAGQLPLVGLDVLPSPEPALLGQSLLVSGLLLFLLTTACGLYPSWLATRIHPAEALHYE